LEKTIGSILEKMWDDYNRLGQMKILAFKSDDQQYKYKADD
jgi:hypothetical protein